MLHEEMEHGGIDYADTGCVLFGCAVISCHLLRGMAWRIAKKLTE